MCDCKEVQDVRPFIADMDNNRHLGCTPTGDFYYGFREKIVWLPRQDQLQEMLGETHSVRPISLVGFLHQVLNEDLTCTEEVPCNGCVEEAKYWRSFGSMEKLWLAFVMKEKFNKAWDGKWL